MADRDPNRLTPTLYEAFDVEQHLRDFSEGKAYTPFDKMLREGLQSLFEDEEEDIVAEEEKKILTPFGPEAGEELVYDPEMKSYVYPLEQQKMDEALQSFTLEEKEDPEIRQKAVQESFGDFPEPPSPPIFRDEDFDAEAFKDQFYPERQDSLVTSAAKTVGDFFGADLITRKDGGFGLWLDTHNKEINKDLKVAVAGGARGFAAIPQLGHLLWKYGLGSMEQLGWALAGEGFVDYDRLYTANSWWKDFSEGSEEFTKGLERLLDIKDRDTMEQILLYTADLAVPLGYPGKIGKAVWEMGFATQKLDGFIRFPGFQEHVPSRARIDLETKAAESLENEVKKLKANPSWEQANRVNQARSQAKDALLKQGLKQLKDSAGKRLRWEKYGDEWWEWGYNLRPRTQGETVMAQKRVRTREEALREGAPEYEDVLLINKSSPEQLLFRENYKKILHGQAVVGGGTVAGTWASWYEGTEMEDFAYAAALIGALASPTATMRFIELAGDAFTSGLQRVPFDLNLFAKLGARMPGVDSDFELTIPSVIYLGGLLARRSAETITGRDPVDMADTSFMKRMVAMSHGIPFYKVMFLDDTSKIKMGDQKTSFTALDAAISMHGVNLRAQEKMARWAEDNMPKEFLESIKSLFYYGQRLENRLREIGAPETKLEEFFLTMEEMVGAVQLQQRNAIIGAMHKDRAFVKSIYGFGGLSGKAEQSNILTTMRVANQEASDRLDFLSDSLDNLIGGDEKLAREFIEFKKIIDAFILTSRKDINDSTMYLDELVDKQNIYLNFEKQVDLTRQLKDNFKLDETIGVVDDAVTKSHKKELFGQRISDRLLSFYERQREAKDLEFSEMLGKLSEKDINAGSFTDSLEGLRKETLEDFGDIFHILKDRARVMAYGPNKDILSGQDSIDNIISYARYNALEGKSDEALEDILLGISQRLSDSKADVALYSPTFRHATSQKPIEIKIDTKDGGVLNLESILTKEVYTDEGMLIPGITRIDQLVSNTGVSKNEYLKRLISNLSGGNDIRENGARAILNRNLRSKLSASDMHTIRSNLGNWSFKKKHTPAGQRVHELVKDMDQVFNQAGLGDTVADANARYSEWKKGWHDSFLGKKLLQTESEKELVGSAPKAEEILEIFFSTKDTKSASAVFETIFKGIDDFKIETIQPKIRRKDLLKQQPSKILQDDLYYSVDEATEKMVKSKGSKIPMTAEKQDIIELMDSSLGHLLYRTDGKLNISNYKERLNKIDELHSFGMISENAHKSARKVVEILDPLHSSHIDEQFRQAENNIKRLVKAIVDETNLAIDQSVLNTLNKSQDTGLDLLKFLAPAGRQATAGKLAAPAEENISSNLKKLRDATKKLRKDMDETFGRDRTKVLGEELDEKLRVFESVPMDQRVQSRFNAVLKDIMGIEDVEQFIKNAENLKKLDPGLRKDVQEKIKKIESLRDVLIGSALKDSRTLLKERRAELRTSELERFNKLRGGKDAKEYFGGTFMGPYKWQEKYFRLSADIDIQAFGSSIDDMWPILSRINELTGNSKFNEDLTGLFAGLVAIRGEIPMADEAFAAIPRGLTTSAALSRLYSGFRGVVSWRYLASEQLIREHQRRKGLILHAILTDPNFVRNLSDIIQGNRLNKKEMAAFAGKLVSIAGPRFAVWNPEKREMDYDPDANQIVQSLRRILLNPKEIEDVDLDWRGAAKRKKEKKEDEEFLEWKSQIGIPIEPGIPMEPGGSLLDPRFWEDEEDEEEEYKKKKKLTQGTSSLLDPSFWERDH